MAVEVNSVEIENFPLLKFRAPPHRRQRWQSCFRGAIGRAHPNNYRSMSSGDGIQMVNRFQITRNYLLAYLIDFFFNTIDNLLHLHRLFDCPIEPIDPGYIGTKIQSQLRIVAQKARDFDGMFTIDPERCLLRWAAVGHDVYLRAGRRGVFEAGFDLLERFHSLSTRHPERSRGIPQCYLKGFATGFLGSAALRSE